MKYFVISDIHGHYNEMFEALNKANYDENDIGHKLIVAGDMFDRGLQNKEVFEFLYRLKLEDKAIIIKGNHECFFDDIFNDDYENIKWNILHNGFKETINSFAVNYKSFEDIKRNIENYPNLKQFLCDLPYYFETKNYVITHAGLDFSNGDFRVGNWEQAIWTKPEHFFTLDLKKEYNFNKILVVGHRFTGILRRYFGLDQNDYSIYYHYDNQKIGIDGGVYHTKQLNVFVFEDVLA